MNKKLVTLIVSLSLLSNFMICCTNEKKEAFNKNSTIDKVDKKTFDEVIEEFNTANISILSDLKDDFLNLRDNKVDKKIYENILDKLNTTIKNMKSFSYFNGKEKDFVNKSIKYFEALHFDITCTIDPSLDTSEEETSEKFKKLAEKSKDIFELSENIENELGFPKKIENILNTRQDCIKLMNELGYKYKDGSEDLFIK